MLPLYFGSSSRRLFGLYSPAERKRSLPRAVVLCHPWGSEYERAHRSMRMLDSTLSAAGFDVLRFDYYGSGDSTGEASEVTLAGWESDIVAAVEEIKDTTGTSRVALVGLRLGATLAARVAARMPTCVRDLVLWDPVVFGDEYLEEMWHHELAAAAHVARPADVGGGHEMQGYPLTETLEREIRALNLIDLVPRLPARTLCITTSVEHGSHAALEGALAHRAAAPAPVEYIEASAAWLPQDSLGAGVVPVPVLHRIREWLG